MEATKRKKRSPYKVEQRTTTVAAAVEDAFSALEELGSECREAADNMGGSNLAGTERCQRYEEAADQLEGASAPDVPECVADLVAAYGECVPTDRRRSPSRATRRDNAVAMLQAVMESAQGAADDVEGETEEARQELKDAIEAFVDEAQSAIDEVEGVDFPGFYG